MKKNEFDFSVPHRQAAFAIIMILYKTIKLMVKQIFPVILVILIGGTKNKTDFLILAVGIISALSAIFAIINYYKTYFYVKNHELFIQSGIFKKKNTSIPFERIQTINFEQHFLHQIFSVLSIKIDTAGSEKTEFEFDAIEVNKAKALRDMIFAYNQSKDKVSHPTKQTHQDDRPTADLIMQLSVTDLIRVGLTFNHLKSAGLIFFFILVLFDNLKDVGIEVEKYSEDAINYNWTQNLIIILGISFVVISILTSLINIILAYFDLKFLRIKNGFKIIRGLFTRVEVSAMDHKIQHILWGNNLIQNLSGYKELRLNQASSAHLKAKQSIKIPGCRDSHIAGVIRTLFGDINLHEGKFYPINDSFYKRFAWILSLLFIPAIVISIWMGFYLESVIALVLLIYLILSRYIRFTKIKYAVIKDLLYVKGGLFGHANDLFPLFKIQGVQLRQSPYQVRKNLCSITFHTASGKLKIPYISIEEGHQLVNLSLYKAESSKKKWM